MLFRLWNFIRSRWVFTRLNAREAAAAVSSRAETQGESADGAPGPALSPVEAGFGAAQQGLADWEDEPDEEEDFAGEDGDGVDPAEADPFISSAPATSPLPAVSLADRREIATREALAGVHKIYLNIPAGPGSLAEALATLLAHGQVTAEFIDPPDDEPHIRYEPVVRK